MVSGAGVVKHSSLLHLAGLIICVLVGCQPRPDAQVPTLIVLPSATHTIPAPPSPTPVVLLPGAEVDIPPTPGPQLEPLALTATSVVHDATRTQPAVMSIALATDPGVVAATAPPLLATLQGAGAPTVISAEPSATYTPATVSAVRPSNTPSPLAVAASGVEAMEARLRAVPVLHNI
ncbi:MAG: hypothetical protein HC828_08120, partial [Blastochloris sp.]|nr:hypothetical protein [Blastochloris sp.]